MVDISTPIWRVREEVMMQYNSVVRGESARVHSPVWCIIDDLSDVIVPTRFG